MKHFKRPKLGAPYTYYYNTCNNWFIYVIGMNNTRNPTFMLEKIKLKMKVWYSECHWHS